MPRPTGAKGAVGAVGVCEQRTPTAGSPPAKPKPPWPVGTRRRHLCSPGFGVRVLFCPPVNWQRPYTPRAAFKQRGDSMYYPPPPTPGSCPQSPQGRCRLSPPAQDLGARLWPSTLVPPTDVRRTPWAVTTELSPDGDKVPGAIHGALNCEAARRAPPHPPSSEFYFRLFVTWVFINTGSCSEGIFWHVVVILCDPSCGNIYLYLFQLVDLP